MNIASDNNYTKHLKDKSLIMHTFCFIFYFDDLAPLLGLQQ